MSDLFTNATDEKSDASAAKRRAFFPGKLFGRDPEESNAADEPAPTSTAPPTSSLVQTSAEPAARDSEPAVPPRITLPAAMRPVDQPLPAPGRAVAQVTFSFAVTAFGLTPFFRLGSLDLKALSNTVSLGLVVASDAGNPLAAGVSFRIGRVELDGTRLRSLVLMPLNEARAVAPPTSHLRVEEVAMTSTGDAPIRVTAGGEGATVVQLVGTFALTGIGFSPNFEVESLRLEPTSPTVRLRVASSSSSANLGLLSSFDLTEVHLGEEARLDRVRLLPAAVRTAD